MEEDYVTEGIIGCAIEVHRELGPGLFESAYQVCLNYELQKLGFSVQPQADIPLFYKGEEMDCAYRADFIVDKKVIVEIKAVDKIAEIHKAQLMSYMKLADMKVGLLINFNVRLLKHGIVRWVI